MTHRLEDELGDILQKARDGKDWSQKNLADETGISLNDIERMERYELIPSDEILGTLASALDLDKNALSDIAHDLWAPEPPSNDPACEVTCLEVYMGSYPVKCYLLTCPETKKTAVVDTGANPEAIIKKADELGLQPEKILLTHNHPDHVGGLSKLDKKFNCPSWIGVNEPSPSGSRDLQTVTDGERIKLGSLEIEAMDTPGHTAGGVSFRVGRTVFSGDCIFAGSMGRANTSWSGLYESITQRLLTLPEDTLLLPGHGPGTTVGEEKNHNPFFCAKG